MLQAIAYIGFMVVVMTLLFDNCHRFRMWVDGSLYILVSILFFSFIIYMISPKLWEKLNDPKRR